jgi:hypothetical protein
MITPRERAHAIVDEMFDCLATTSDPHALTERIAMYSDEIINCVADEALAVGMVVEDQ